jgi:hypothetical protein
MRRIAGFLLVVLGLLLVAALASSISDIARGVDVSDSIGGAVVLAIGAAASGLGARRCLGPAKARRPVLSRDEREHLVLERARAAGGKLTQAELALDSGLSLDEARRLLDELAEKGAAELELSSSGVLVYSFPGLISAAEKSAAKPVDEA